METVYIETSVVSYLTSRPSRDIVVAAHQQVTREWWENVLFSKFEPYVSDAVLDEVGRGDPDAASLRLSAVAGIKRLELNDEVKALTAVYCKVLNLPASAQLDAVHLAVSVLNRVDFLVSWNCRHIANGHVIKAVQVENGKRGLPTPIICTPDELVEG